MRQSAWPTMGSGNILGRPFLWENKYKRMISRLLKNTCWTG
jgi:hypothetical protein